MEKNKYCIIKTTCKNKDEAKNIARILIDAKLIACAQINKIESLYFWEDKIMDETEFLLSVKTKSVYFKPLKKLIIENHSYQNPQLIQINIENGSKAYFDWIEGVLK